MQVPKMPPGFSPAKLLPQQGTPQAGPSALQQRHQQSVPTSTPQRQLPMPAGQPSTPQHLHDGQSAPMAQFYGHQRPAGRQSIAGSEAAVANRAAAASPVNPAYAGGGWGGTMQQMQTPVAMRQMQAQQQQMRNSQLRSSGMSLPG